MPNLELIGGSGCALWLFSSATFGSCCMRQYLLLVIRRNVEFSVTEITMLVLSLFLNEMRFCPSFDLLLLIVESLVNTANPV